MFSPSEPRPRALWWWPRPIHKFVGQIQRRTGRYPNRSWFEHAELTADWTSANLTPWRMVLSPWRNEALRILEIGSWEGRSCLFFLNYFPRSIVVCIDHFADNETLAELSDVEDRFDRNLAPFAGRVEKIKSHSIPALECLAAESRRFDLVYLDAHHTYDLVMQNSVRLWTLTEPGSVIIWDDYRWGRDLPPEQRAKAAIEEFLRVHAGSYRLLRKDYQVMVERLR